MGLSAYREYQTDMRDAKFKFGQSTGVSRAIGNYRASSPEAFHAALGGGIGLGRGIHKAAQANLDLPEAIGSTLFYGAAGAGIGGAFGAASSRYKHGGLRHAQKSRLGQFGVPPSTEALFHKSHLGAHIGT